ncbi:MAG: hypothetical protein HC913_01060 [Microscillaceae bacterium]|nr:hypothetical protein [Microscillaceae bacterium]
MKKRFAELLHRLSHLPMAEQKQALHEELHRWRSGSSQTDDIVVVGLKI